MKNVSEAVYLGQILDSTGSIDPTIQSRKLKAVGINSQIMSLLNSVSLGRFYVQVGLVLRDAMLVNSILTGCEAWPYLTEENIHTLEDCDVSLMRKIFSSHPKVNKISFYIETAKLPLRYIISKRRLMYHHHILTRNLEELIRKVYQAQKENPCIKDWALIVNEEKLKYNIFLSDEQISTMSKRKYKLLVDNQVNKFAFHKLLETARTQSKCSEILHNLETDKIQIQEYLKSNKFTKEYQQVLFSLRTKSYPFKINFRHQFHADMSCRICEKEDTIEDFHHTIICEEIIKYYSGGHLNFDDVYGSLKEQLKFIQSFIEIHRIRKIILEVK